MRIKTQYLGMVLQDPFDLMVEEYASGQSSHRPDVTRNASEVRILPLLFRTNGQMMHTGIQSYSNLFYGMKLDQCAQELMEANEVKLVELLLVRFQHILLG